MNIKDTLVIVLSDLHSGSTVSLFPNRFWQFQHTNHTSTPLQVELWKHFELCVEAIKQARRKRRLIVIHDGDAIEGANLGSHQVITQNPLEQVEIHTELMDYFLRHVGFCKKSGDLLYYVSGTEVHTDDNEERCAADLDAECTRAGLHIFDKLELTINGVEIWAAHHGPSRGSGPNAGNTLRNWLRNIHYECLSDGLQMPDMIVTGHTHTPCYQCYIQDWGDGYHILHGIICPSWQSKTRYAFRKAPVQLNRIGLVSFEITASGNIIPPKFMVMKNHEEKVRV
jgi:predicted phosphodiesterase